MEVTPSPSACASASLSTIERKKANKQIAQKPFPYRTCIRRGVIKALAKRDRISLNSKKAASAAFSYGEVP